MLHVDIPTHSEITKLVAARGEALVSIHVRTTPETRHIDAARTGLKQMTAAAIAQLEAVGVDKTDNLAHRRAASRSDGG